MGSKGLLQEEGVSFTDDDNNCHCPRYHCYHRYYHQQIIRNASWAAYGVWIGNGRLTSSTS